MKVAFFLEGHTELIFVRGLLMKLVPAGSLLVESCQLLHGTNITAPRLYHRGAAPEIEARLINIGGDNKVVGALKTHERSYFKNGFDLLIGLRDMYSVDYCSMAKVINPQVSHRFIDGHLKEVAGMSRPDRIKVFFSIMEVEAWLLALHPVLTLIDASLTTAAIAKRLKFSLDSIDPETEFFKPSNNLAEVLALGSKKYKLKSQDFVEAFVASLEVGHCEDLCRRSVVPSFQKFYQQLKDICGELANGAS